MTLLISEQDVKKVLSIKSAIPVIEDAFRMQGERSTVNPGRYRMAVGFQEPYYEGFLQYQPAALQEKGIVGFKLFPNFGNRTMGGHYGGGFNFIYNAETAELLAIVHSYAVSTMRTAAASAVAVKHLSPESASILGLCGTGRQAKAQLEAVRAVRKIKRAYVYSQTPDHRVAFCKEMSEKLNIDCVPVATAAETAKQAEIVIMMTNSFTPVLFGEALVRPGLVVAAGANHWNRREIDEKLIARSNLVVVDEREQAKIEGGALIWAVSVGMHTWERTHELGEIVVGRVKPPSFDSGNILFCSHGVAIEDMAIATKALELAKAQGLGTPIDLEVGRH